MLSYRFRVVDVTVVDVRLSSTPCTPKIVAAPYFPLLVRVDGDRKKLEVSFQHLIDEVLD